MTVCRACKYFRPDHAWITRQQMVTHGMCAHPKATTTDVVTGNLHHCKARDFRSRQDDACGADGTLFEAETNVLKRAVRGNPWEDWVVLGMLCVGAFAWRVCV